MDITVAIIHENKKYLLIKRLQEPFKDYWSFISGKGGFEKTKDLEEAVKDEVKHDINCEFLPTKLIYQSDDEDSKVSYFLGEIIGKVENNPGAVKENRWFSLEEIERLNLAFNQNEVLNLLKEQPKNYEREP